MTARLLGLWHQLAGAPLLWLLATLAAYLFGGWVHRRLHGHPLANPVAIAIATLALVLSLTGTPYATYVDGAGFIHFLLGPATVALAVPLYQNLDKVRRMLPSIVIGLLVGSSVSVLSAAVTARLLGASAPVVLSLAPKSATSPIAMGVAEAIGGIPSLTAVLVILTGILGAMVGWPLLVWLKVDDPASRGFALGVAAHGIGTARAFQIDFMAGTFAGLAMGLNGLVTALITPPLVALLSP